VSINLVYYVGPSHNDHAQLRYSLRAAAATLELGEVWIVGTIPSWLVNAGCIPVEQGRYKSINTWRNWTAIAAACQHGLLPGRFTIMMDDVYVHRPGWGWADVEGRTLPHALSLGPAVHYLEQSPTWGAGRVTLMRETLDLLDPLVAHNYDLHTPFPVHAHQFAQIVPAMNRWFTWDGRSGRRFLERTLYANLAGYRPIVVDQDVKVYGDQEPPGLPWWSTSDEAFNDGQAGKLIRATWPEPSWYERCE